MNELELKKQAEKEFLREYEKMNLIEKKIVKKYLQCCEWLKIDNRVDKNEAYTIIIFSVMGKTEAYERKSDNYNNFIIKFTKEEIKELLKKM